jgi:hypothetical protein
LIQRDIEIKINKLNYEIKIYHPISYIIS